MVTAYSTVLHYVETSKGFKRSKTMPKAELDDLARALHTAGKRMDELLSGKGVKFNTYVRRVDDARIEVWALPAWQEDGQLAFGLTYRALLDGEGRRILEDDAPAGTLREGTPSSETDWIMPNDEADVPSVGHILHPGWQ